MMDNEVSQKIQLIETFVIDLQGNNIAHEEHGPSGGFHDAEDAKNIACDKLINFLDKTKLLYDRLSPEGVDISLTSIKARTLQLSSLVTKIDGITTLENRATPEYPKQREEITTEINNIISALESELRPYYLEIRVVELEAKLALPEDIQNRLNSVNQAEEKIAQLAKQAEKGVSGIQDKVISKGVETSESHFSTLVDNHKFFEVVWLVAFLISSCFAASLAYDAITSEIKDFNSIKSLIILIKNVLLVVIPLTFMKISLSKYNVERNLRIIYTHRQAVLAQYEYFEKGIGDDVPSKNELRLQVAKYIFTDPETGYLGKDKGKSDININPMMSAVEKIIP